MIVNELAKRNPAKVNNHDKNKVAFGGKEKGSRLSLLCIYHAATESTIRYLSTTIERKERRLHTLGCGTCDHVHDQEKHKV